jgi:lipopolysaccharide/colanic/teichoic acid biosynthesis glycosyltransferase
MTSNLPARHHAATLVRIRNSRIITRGLSAALHLGGWMSSMLSQPLSFPEPREEVARDLSSRRLEKATTLPLSFEKQGIHQMSLRKVHPLVSVWSTSAWKRIFDCACVMPFLPVLIPVVLVIALAVRLTSRGPAFFFQKRMGLNGRTFTIFKFRTLEHREDKCHNPVTTSANQRFTPIGPFLRNWKLDELPQILNVLIGDMSLVGPRPKLPEHQLSLLFNRPGITGAATLAFAREESFLSRLSQAHLDQFYQDVILPAKQRIDQEYAARATFLSDLTLLLRTLSRKWDTSIMEDLLSYRSAHDRAPVVRSREEELPTTMRPVFVTSDRTQSMLGEPGPSLVVASETQPG